MRLRLLFITGAAVTAVSCGPGAFMHGTFYGVQYSTVGEAESVRRSARWTALANIETLPSPAIKRNLTISVPTFESLRRYRDVVDPPGLYKAAQYARDFFDRDFVHSVNFLSAAIRRRGLYMSVEIIESDVFTPNPIPTATQDHIRWKFNPTMWGTQMFYISEKLGSFAVTPDNSASSLTDSTEVLIETLFRLAQIY